MSIESASKLKSLLNINMGLKTKIQIFIVVTSLITIIPILIYFQLKSSSSMVTMAKDQLVSLREISKKRVELYFENSTKFTAGISKNRLVESMFIALEGSFFSDGFTVGQDLDIMTQAYNKAEAEYGPRTKSIIDSYNFDNMMLATTGGQIIFNVKNDQQHQFLGKNLISGSLSQTTLAKCFKDAKDSTDQSATFFADFQYYQSTDAVASFICTKHLSEFDHLSEGIKAGDFIGIIITQINISYINSILMERSGMGESGQIYLVGSDGKLRSDMFVNQDQYNVFKSFQNNILITSSSQSNAINGKTSIHEIKNINEKPVISAYTPLVIMGQTWALIVEKNTSEIMSPVYTILRQIIVNAAIVLIVVMIIAYFFGKSIIDPILRVSKTLNKSSKELSIASEELNDASNKLSSSSNQQAAATQESVAAMQEMASMINQTAEFSHKSKDISDIVKNMTNEGDKIMKNMVDSMSDINKENENMRGMVDVIKDISKKTTVINDIVFKTQLLSFNASIEAARAGQHGKGFAVVAEEVGKLANMSGNASREIYTLLENSQKKVNEAVKSTEETVKRGQDVTNKAQAIFRQIADNISLINEQIQRIVEATNEQNKGVQQTETALKQLDDAAKGNSEVAVKAQNNSNHLQKAKDELNAIVNTLNNIILGHTRLTNDTSIENEISITPNSSYVDPQLLDGIVAKKDSLNDDDFEKMV